MDNNHSTSLPTPDSAAAANAEPEFGMAPGGGRQLGPIDYVPGLLWSSLPTGYIDFLNLRWLEYTGMDLQQAMGWGWQEALHPDDLPPLLDIWRGLLTNGSPGEAKARLRRRDGAYRWFLFRAVPFYDQQGKVVKWYGQTTDIDDLKRAEAFLAGEKRLLEMVAKGSALSETLDTMCRMIDDMCPGVYSAVLMLDHRSNQLRYAAAPHVPPPFVRATDNSPVTTSGNPGCLAALTRQPVLIPDREDERLSSTFRALTLQHGIRGILSTPIMSSSGEVLGAFNLHSRGTWSIEPEQQVSVEQLIQLAAVAAERKHIDAVLKDSEERFRLMAETTPDVIWITEFHPERVLYVNPSFERLWERRIEEIYDDPRVWMEPIHPEDVAHVTEVFERGVAGNGNSRYDIEYRLLHHDGSINWIHERGVFLANPHGRVNRANGISTDITVRKSAEAALHASEERFSLAMAASSDGIWDWDVVSDAMFMSDRAQYIVGLEPGPGVRRLTEWKTSIRFHSDDADVLGQLLADYLAGTAPSYDHELRIQDASGEYRWIRVRGQCMRDGRGQPTRLTGSVSDIDLQKRTEAALEQARRMEAIGTLAGGIAHDFNNILGAVLGYGEMALRGARRHPRLLRDLNNIVSAGQRGRALVDRILAFSRSGLSDRIVVHVNTVVQEALGHIRVTLPANIRLEAQLDADQDIMLGDPTQVHQVVMNLTTNAIQAMPQGGTLQVSLASTQIAKQTLTRTGLLQPGDYLVLRVSDTGMGISPEIMNRIFDPFFTTKEMGVGTGLGLTLVHGIVSQVRGAIDVASAPGVGTTFTVYAPQAGDAYRDEDAEEPDFGYEDDLLDRHGNREHILIVDDEEPLASLAAQILAELNYIPFTFTSGVAALDAFRKDPGRYDAVISDERMPGLTGSVLIAEIRKLRPSVPVLLMSGYFGDNGNATPREMLADEILRKPVARQELADAVARLLAHR
jgi:PAS domain S-box-containing protein